MTPGFTKFGLRDFQCHESLLLELEAITTICGPTDRGKSAILRALRWVCLNEGRAESFIRIGADATRAQLLVDGKTVARKRSKSSNSYSLGKAEFKAFGTGVPQDISDLLGVNEMNFQGQHDSPYWFAATGGEVSRELNSIVDLDIIDACLAKISSAVREVEQKHSFALEKLTQLEEQLKDEGKLRIEEFDTLSAQREKAEELREDERDLRTTLESIEEIKLPELEERASDAEQLFSSAKGTLSLSSQVESLGELLEEIEELRPKAEPPPDFSLIEKEFQRFQETMKGVDALGLVLRRLSAAEDHLASNQEKLRKAQVRWQESTKNEVCPLCENPL